MPEILPLRPEQTAEAKLMIYSVAHLLFHEHETLEKSIAYYESNWHLRDVDDFQRSYNENDGIFLAINEGGRLIGTGALRRLDETTAEIKRLWLLPEYWGKGLGYQMMMRLLAAARENGYRRVRLETSSNYQQRAYAFYHRLGFYDIPRFGDDPDDVALELLL